jgi:hypothetical protein
MEYVTTWMEGSLSCAWVSVLPLLWDHYLQFDVYEFPISLLLNTLVW